MISHKYRCIFIHIPRTGGTSVEAMIAGGNWWDQERSTKHLLASQARRLYADYWDEYFKFSFVRDPVTRVVSCLKYANYFGLSAGRNGNIRFGGYRRRFGRTVVVEFDRRFFRRAEVLQPQHCPGSVYGNILDEKLDFIGRFENLADDVALIKSRLKIAGRDLPHLERSAEPPWRPNEQALADIGAIYARDLVRFGYAAAPLTGICAQVDPSALAAGAVV
jgi:hypothetical protein